MVKHLTEPARRVESPACGRAGLVAPQGLPADRVRRSSRSVRCGILLGLALVAIGWQSGQATEPSVAAARPDEFPEFFREHCWKCHSAEKADGNFRLDTLPLDWATQATAERWAEVRFRINAGEMPPPDEPAPSAAEIEQVVGWLSENLTAGEAARMAARGPVMFYRLSREEYAQTIYDLLGVHYDVQSPGALIEDPRWHGFERIGSSLSLSPAHVERYLRAAETVLDRAFPASPVQSSKYRADAIEMRHRDQRQQLEAQGIADRVRAVVWPDGSIPGMRPYWSWQQFQQSGRYRARIQLSGLPGLDGRAPHLSVWHPALRKTIYDEDILAPEDQPTVIEFEVFLEMPTELELVNEVPRTFVRDGNHTLNVLNSGGSVFTTTADTSRLNPTGYQLTTDDRRAIYPLLLIDWIEWEGPLVTESDLAKRAGLVPAAGASSGEILDCLRRFASRAWRRPVTDSELSRYLRLLEQELSAGESPAAAYRAAMVAVLSSQQFYYIQEGSAVEQRATVTDIELASRLSYFLWSSLPDNELLEVAAKNELHQPAILQQQLARMLTSDRIQRFTEAFPRQWLQLHKVGSFPPDPKLYPDYDLWLEKCMVLETTGYFAEVLEQNLSIREFLDSDWTIANPRLARHYQLPQVTEMGFQRVSLRPEDHRGGLLTQSSVLMLTSDGTRHRPVHRGVWVSEAIFGRTPPPPPPNVEPLAPTPLDRPKATIREQLEAHATHAVCAACHRGIDPLGFAFDQYDAIGRWRTTEVIEQGQGDNPRANPAGTLPDGRSFADSAEFKQLLAADLDRFALAFIEQLATFALRRVMTIDDADELRAIASAARNDDYRLQAVILELVTSPLFQKR